MGVAGQTSSAVTESVHRGVLEALAEVGLHSLSVEAVAGKAGVNKTTIYRRWGTIEQLLVEVLVATAEAQVPIPDTGSYVGDLTALCRAVRDALAAPGGRVLIGSMWSASGDRMASIAEQWWANRVQVMAKIFAAAEARGDCASTAAPAELLERLSGPIHLRSGLLRKPMSDAEIDQLIAIVIG